MAHPQSDRSSTTLFRQFWQGGTKSFRKTVELVNKGKVPKAFKREAGI